MGIFGRRKKTYTVPDKVKIDGKTYHELTFDTRKAVIEKEAKQRRAEGYSVRILKKRQTSVVSGKNRWVWVLYERKG